MVHLDDKISNNNHMLEGGEMKTYLDVGPESGISPNRPHVFGSRAPGNPGLPPTIAALAPHLRHIR